MIWNEFLLNEIAWLRYCAQNLADKDPLLAQWYTTTADLSERLKQFPLGKSHNEHCTCGHEHSHMDDAGYLYSKTGNPVDLSPLGFGVYIPGEGGIDSGNIRELKEFGSHQRMQRLPIVVSTPERAKQLALASNHPLKKKLPTNPFSYGHIFSLVLNEGIFMDKPTYEKLVELSSFDIENRIHTLPLFSDDELKEFRIFKTAKIQDIGDTGKMMLHYVTHDGVLMSFDIEC